MTPKKATFFVNERQVRGETEWAGMVQLDGAPAWCIFEWGRKPSEQEIQDFITIATRSFEVYHKHLTIPRYDLQVDQEL